MEIRGQPSQGIINYIGITSINYYIKKLRNSVEKLWWKKQ
jgi:hypothetical protein